MTSVTVNADLTVHVVSSDGTGEFFLPSYNPETMVPFASAAQAEDCGYDFANRLNCWQPYKSPEEREQERNAQTIAGNKSIRNAKLAECDWTQIGDVSLTADCKADFAVYRKFLRDADMLDPVWPDAPAEEWVA